MKDGKNRKKWTAEDKFKIVRECLTTDTGVTEICKKYDISSGLYYKWQEKFLQGALEGFKQSSSGPTTTELRQIGQLQKDNDRMKTVIAEITAENIDFKKKLMP